MSNCYIEKGKDSIVFSYLEKAKKIGLETKDTILLLEISNHYAIEYDHIGDSAKSLKEYLRVKKMASNLEDKKYLLTIYENIGVTYSHKKLYHKALKYFKKSKKLSVKIKDTVAIVKTLCNMTRPYMYLNDLDNATKSINQGIEIVEKTASHYWL